MIFCLWLTASAASAAAVPVDKSVYMDATRSVEERVAALLPQMTLEEKQSQTINWAPGDCCGPAQIKEHFAGIGLGALSNGGASTPAGLAAQNKLQLWMINNTRLGIPISFSAETLHSGVGGGSKDVSGNGGGSVMFPMPCMQGATWNTPLIEEVARVIGLEASASGNDRGFSPEINVCTDPRFGRTEENFGCVSRSAAPAAAAHHKWLHVHVTLLLLLLLLLLWRQGRSNTCGRNGSGRGPGPARRQHAGAQQLPAARNHRQ